MSQAYVFRVRKLAKLLPQYIDSVVPVYNIFGLLSDPTSYIE